MTSVAEWKEKIDRGIADRAAIRQSAVINARLTADDRGETMQIDAEGLLAARTAFIAALDGEDGLYHGWQDDRGIDTEDYSIDGGFNLNEALRSALTAYMTVAGPST